ncbi:hypothetical protein [Algoriphagus yeomjeoni]|uniref:Uncharacterized protein n=1 Tax=Algoriphagus yeomjeoni TaxID=291403 RepID=A0A327PQ57_9BACT|nr:hypothetical protein [Algoriphagus yeomjeoni]RAI93853.1 hypothetical protein LV83_00759 [Algoriphagus yeomjeoni]
MIRIRAGIAINMTTLLVSDKSIGPVGLGTPFGTWEYERLGIRSNAKSKLNAVEIYFNNKLFIIRAFGLLIYQKSL